MPLVLWMMTTLRPANTAAEAANRQLMAKRTRRSISIRRPYLSVPLGRVRVDRLTRSWFPRELKPRLNDALRDRRRDRTPEPRMLRQDDHGDLRIVRGGEAHEPG